MTKSQRWVDRYYEKFHKKSMSLSSFINSVLLLDRKLHYPIPTFISLNKEGCTLWNLNYCLRPYLVNVCANHRIYKTSASLKVKVSIYHRKYPGGAACGADNDGGRQHQPWAASLHCRENHPRGGRGQGRAHLLRGVCQGSLAKVLELLTLLFFAGLRENWCGAEDVDSFLELVNIVRALWHKSI